MDYDPKMNRLSVLRKSNNLSQQDMADRLGIAISTYKNFEYGYRGMKVETIIEVCQMFGCSSDWLLGIAGNSYEVINLDEGTTND